MRRIKNIVFLTTIIAFLHLDIDAQRQVFMNSSESGELIDLFTDRSVYVVNEDIYFSAFFRNTDSSDELLMSTVLYVELIKWNGTKIVQLKTPVRNYNANGFLRVPGDLVSGYYYLRAYTKWMRNFSPYSFTYIPVKIVNPSRSDTDYGSEIDNTIYKANERKDFEPEEEITISNMQTSYGKRELVKLSISFPKDFSSGKYCMSVVRTGSLEAKQHSCSFVSGNEEIVMRYFPEIRGLSLSGKVVDKRSRKPLSNTKVNLSSTSIPFYLSTIKTDSDGVFMFTFPGLNGLYEFNLYSDNKTDAPIDLLIDTDYCSKSISLPYRAFQLDSFEYRLIEDLVRNIQISNRFASADTTIIPQEDQYPFYGIPTRIVYEKDFIELKNLEEFLFELVYEVDIRNNLGVPGIFMAGQSTLSSYPALVLMDNIIVTEVQDLLQVACRRIDRIEIVKRGYVIGNFLYSGIVSIYSEGRDMAGLKLYDNSVYFDFSLFKSTELQFPDYSDEGRRNSRIPDRRNTLYWEPEIAVMEDKLTKIEFYTSDVSGEYEIVIRGYNDQDKPIVRTGSKFVVE